MMEVIAEALTADCRPHMYMSALGICDAVKHAVTV